MKRWLIAGAIVALLSLDACNHVSDPIIEADPCMVGPGAVYG